jgi:hypothetical protein
MVNHSNISKNILELVKVFPEVKTNYNALIMYYWTMFDNATTISTITNCTPTESITRAFRKLVEFGLIHVPEVTKAKREAAAKVYKNDFSSLGGF